MAAAMAAVLSVLHCCQIFGSMLCWFLSEAEATASWEEAAATGGAVKYCSIRRRRYALLNI